ncbi:hypothetical protein P154DRAFT_526867 [Amniculicola lignicola CBS 123094]|uniref:Acyl-coenzyme A diphosphatase SCS3 n=1 Tax=Amniculicola lignicola CBS 123094 TaxID=1392246 RepID=A0A6A5W089_9PLEO|nr:hypothetical protein P154DRAFT_526867 [Amniculicola lignicola CBS 123094]
MSARRKSTRLSAANGTPTPLTSAMPASSIRTPNTRSPFVPTRLEGLLLAIYPVTLLLGSVFSTLSPASRSAPYSAASQSHPPEFAPSYFAQKKNVFNVYFVKIGWFWTTLAFVVFLIFNPGFGEGLSVRRIRATLRYLTITFWWIAVTQWFFGPPLIDRGFRFTGGQCELLLDEGTKAGMSETREYITAATCKAVGGSWKGGHDISGHVFLLILASALLWFETLPSLTRAEGLRDGRRIMLDDGKVASVSVEKSREHEKKITDEEENVRSGVKVALVVLGLMWWMLLMTAAYFHTWFEKLTGLGVAFAGLWAVYFLPRGVPALRAVLGMPGV